MNRRDFLGIMSALPLVGLILPKQYLNDIKTIATTRLYSSSSEHPMFGKVRIISIYQNIKYNDVYITFENGTKVKYKIYKSIVNYLDHKHSDEIIEKVCSDVRYIHSEWTYCKNKIKLDNNDELILMSLNIAQPIFIDGQPISGYV